MQFTSSKSFESNALDRWRQGRLFAPTEERGGIADGPVARAVVDLDALEGHQRETPVGSRRVRELVVARQPGTVVRPRRKGTVLDVAELAAALEKSRPRGPRRPESSADLPLEARETAASSARLGEILGVAFAMACCVAVAVLA